MTTWRTLRLPTWLVRTRRVVSLAAAVAASATVEIGLRTMNLHRLAPAVGATLVLDGSAPVVDPQRLMELPGVVVRRMIAVDSVMKRWPLGDTCLRRALVLATLLWRHKTVLRIGVAKVDHKVKAHAWLEVDGICLDPENAALYGVLEPVISGS
jgi:Transglutaminase-like superfamily